MHSGDKNVTNNNNWKKLDHEVNPCAMQIVELAGKNFNYDWRVQENKGKWAKQIKIKKILTVNKTL